MSLATCNMSLFADLSSGDWALILVAVVAGCYVIWLFSLGLSLLVGAMEGLLSAHAWLLQMLVRRQLAKHGLSNEQVVEALLALDQFTFYMLDSPCVCVKGPDGRHEFVFPQDAIQQQPTETSPVELLAHAEALPAGAVRPKAE